MGGDGCVCVRGRGELRCLLLVVVDGDPTIFILPLDPSRTMYDKPAGIIKGDQAVSNPPFVTVLVSLMNWKGCQLGLTDLGLLIAEPSGQMSTSYWTVVH